MPPGILHTFETDLYVDLTNDEVRERGEAMATLHAEVLKSKQDLKDDTKLRKQAITLLETRMTKLADATRFRRELRMVPVDVVDIGDGMVQEIRQDTEQVIRTRKMSEAEQQMRIPNLEDKRAAKQ
ncbi:MAG TPA: hypothetical protein VLA89_05575 [Gemmatimonadales bacterium]|nr:hypothetical protein [Gemmatimonadales bacterium]